MHRLRYMWAATNKEALQRRRARINRRNMEQIASMLELEFIHRFRLDYQSFRRLCDELRRRISLKGTNEISLEIKFLCTLSFLATGLYQRIVGLIQQLIQRTTSRCTHQVVEALNHHDIVKKWIRFPSSPQEQARIQLEFQRRFRLPGLFWVTIGCIYCTHVAIVKPAQEVYLFFNRKGYHSLNVQMVCDSNLKILNVNAKFGGATHDSFIFASSRVQSELQTMYQNSEQVWLLGDSGYPLRCWLMTPILNAAPGSREEIYTQRLVQARNCIERCFGLLKSRWRCLLRHRTLHYHPLVAGKIVNACCVLDNIPLEANLPPPTIMEDDSIQHGNAPDSEVTIDNQSELLQGRVVQNSLLTRLIYLLELAF